MLSRRKAALECGLRLLLAGAVLSFIGLALATQPAFAQTTGKRHALLIGGIGGSPDYQEKFQKYLFETRRSLIERYHFSPDDIIVLAGTIAPDADFINGRSDAETIKKQFAELAEAVSSDDQLYIILFGHGSYDGKNAVLNIPRRDLKDVDYAALLAGVKPKRLVFINTTSASAPFMDHLSASGRIIMTATKSGGERNETVFPRFLIEALESPDSDLDKNGDLSVLEAFQSASGHVDRYFEEENHLATEHALLEDTGDGIGFRAEALLENGEGGLAGVTYLLARRAPLITGASASGDSTLTGLHSEKQTIESQILALRMEKTTLGEVEYLARLEPLFIRLATINDQLESSAVAPGKN